MQQNILYVTIAEIYCKASDMRPVFSRIRSSSPEHAIIYRLIMLFALNIFDLRQIGLMAPSGIHY